MGVFPAKKSATVRYRALIWVLAVLLLPFTVKAVEQATLTADRIAGSGWAAQNLAIELHPEGDGHPTSLTLAVESLTLAGLSKPWHGVRLSCGEAYFSGSEWRCEKGRLRLSAAESAPEFAVRLQQRFEPAGVELEVTPPGSASTVKANFTTQETGWTLTLAAKDFPLAAFNLLLEGLPTLGGSVDLSATVAGNSKGVQQADATLALTQGSITTAAGDYLGEGVTAKLQGTVGRSGRALEGDLALNLTAGELVTPFAYLNATKHPVNLTASLRQTPDEGWALPRFDAEAAQLFKLSGALSVDASGRIAGFGITLPETPLEPIYRELLQPVLAATALETLELRGTLSADLRGDAEGIQAGELTVAAVDVADRRNETSGAFAFGGIEGVLRWGEETSSRLGWREGALMGGLTLGPTELKLGVKTDGATLAEPAHLPILDGELVVEELAISAGASGPELALSGYLTPISMPAFAAAMGWPPLQGQLSGMIPRIRYRDDRIDMDGSLLARLFDGEVVVRNLNLEGPFGPFPRLQADLEVRKVDLETLTRAFAFGKITGRLEGRVSGLVLEQWQPIAFDAALATPPEDSSPHRISQRAVENISNLGGAGLSGALSRNLLQLFEEFRYGRLGFRCRLRDGVCEMEGIEPAEQGYYLVKGSGLPRIDILGFNRRIDWAQLLAKLKQIAAGGTPIVQ